MNKLKIELSENVSGFYGVKYRAKFKKWETSISDSSAPCLVAHKYFNCLVEASQYKDANTISARGNAYSPNEASGAFKRHERRLLKFDGDVGNPVELFAYLNGIHQDKKKKILSFEKRIKSLKRM